jgi:putative ABC transport system permease protein
MQDLRYAFRMLLKLPGFTTVAVLTLALGIGANTAIFTVVEAVLVRRLPFKDPDRLVYVWERNLKSDRTTNVVGPANYVRWKERSVSFESLGGVGEWTGTVTGSGEPEKIPLGYVTADFFRTLGVEAALGRTFVPEEGRPGHDDVALLGHDYWMRKFGGDATVVGKSITLDGRALTIVGVMPRGFRGLITADLWTSIAMSERDRDRRFRWMTVIGRLRPGVTRDMAQEEMSSIAAAIGKEIPDFTGGWGVNVIPMREQLVGNVRPALLVLYGAVCLLLLIAGSNVANLLLARATGRQREMAVRSALGAPRRRLIRQLLTESAVVSLMGGLAGSLVALWAIEGFRGLLPPELARFTDIRVNAPVLAFAILLSVATGLLLGAIPALGLTRAPIEPALREGTLRGGTSRGRLRVRGALVVIEAALSLILLVGAGLLLESFSRLSGVDLGVRTEGVLSLDLALPSGRYTDPRKVAQFFDRAVESVRGVPGITSAGAISWRLLAGGSATSYSVAGEPEPAPGQAPVADVRIVTPDLFATLRIPLLRGRLFAREDSAAAPKRVVINEVLARQHWPRESPIGKHIVMSWGEAVDAEVIGVVGDVRLAALDTEPRGTLYWAEDQLPNDFMTLTVRTQGDPRRLVGEIKAKIGAIDPDVPVAGAKTLDEVKAESLTSRRFTTLLLEIFAGVALALAALGNYGVLAFSVAERTQEIGIRMALGARAEDVLLMVIRQGMRLAFAGLAIGLAGAATLSRFMSGLLFEMSPTDPLVFLGVSLLLAAVSLAACALPARRAAHVDPMIALRSE